MLDDCTAVTKMSVDKSKEDYAICNNELDQKYFIAWSPLEENKFSFKHRYVSCSRSVPQKNKRFVRYRISRSLNFDASICNSSSESSSFEEDKHLSRSAKIMRALNFNNSPSYYGKTKIKKSLNFNLTPSPKRFRHIKKDIRKSLSLNFNPPLSVSNKFLSFDDNPSDSANSSLLFSSSDSIDENQNETPSQQNPKEHDMIHYSTPNAKLSKKSLCSSNFTPLLRSRLKETIDNIVYVTTTPNSQSLKRIKGSSKHTSNIAMNSSRNLLHEFHDKDDSRPCTPQNLICLIPESMTAIKRSHKKERSSKRNEHCATQFTNNFVNDENIIQDRTRPLLTRHKKYIDTSQDSKSDIDRCGNKNFNFNELALSHSEDDMSDTGSLFDYTEEMEHILKESKVSDWSANYSKVEPKIHEFDVEIKPEENIIESLSEFQASDEHELLQDRGIIDVSNLSNRNIELTAKARSVTPEPGIEIIVDSQKSITPENRINILQTIAKDSIKKSHKKTKDDNKRRLFSPKVLQGKLNASEGQESIKCSKNSEQHENIIDESKMFVEQDCPDASVRRSSTPEKVNSSRLLLSQFSSIKKSHKKDKHNKILSGFLKRQEYFNKDMDIISSSKYKTFNIDGISKCKNGMQDSSSDLDVTIDIGDPTSSATSANLNTSLDKLSPSKRKKEQSVLLDCERSMSCDSELQELDTSKEEFKIFTPLKRKKSLIASAVIKEYSHFYDFPYEKNELSENGVTNISFSRCLTPVPNFANSSANTKYDDITIDSNDNVNNEDIEEDSDFDNVTGRLTPRNMSTTELYPNLDSIKKSHKKNKRGNSSRQIRSNHHADEKHEIIPVENTANETYDPLESSNECITVNDVMNKSIYDKLISNDDMEDPINFTAGDQQCASTSTENISSTATPPNCLKMKNYIKVLQETSIKRSHKKVRDKRKQESIVDANELSDDGSIFGNDEKLDSTGDKYTHD